jgi:hypothetical protein
VTGGYSTEAGNPAILALQRQQALLVLLVVSIRQPDAAVAGATYCTHSRANGKVQASAMTRLSTASSR